MFVTQTLHRSNGHSSHCYRLTCQGNDPSAHIYQSSVLTPDNANAGQGRLGGRADLHLRRTDNRVRIGIA